MSILEGLEEIEKCKKTMSNILLRFYNEKLIRTEYVYIDEMYPVGDKIEFSIVDGSHWFVTIFSVPVSVLDDPTPDNIINFVEQHKRDLLKKKTEKAIKDAGAYAKFISAEEANRYERYQELKKEFEEG